MTPFRRGYLGWAVVLLALSVGCDDTGPAQAPGPLDAGNLMLDAQPRDAGTLPIEDAGQQPDALAGDAQVADAGPPTPDAAAPGVCPEPLPARLALQVMDVNGDPLEPGDAVEVTVWVQPQGAADTPAWLVLQHGNVTLPDDAVIQLNGAPVEAMADGNTRTIALPNVAEATITYTATVTGREALMAVFATLNRTATGCPNPHSNAGALLQLIGGNGKTPVCIDLDDYAALQIAPAVPLRNTEAYREANGQREDLLADDFIFCPQAPTVVHTAEFCAIHHPGLRVSLAGSPRGGGQWEVDDFVLFEVARNQGLLADGVTTQRHPGGDTFWCGEIAELMCTEGCVASLTRDGAAIEALAVVDATGAQARLHQDGAVSIGHLFPDDEASFALRVTALDVGVEGTIASGLYLVVEP